ncbi:hypothetical protein D3C80_1731210 [compost metagenome]
MIGMHLFSVDDSANSLFRRPLKLPIEPALEFIRLLLPNHICIEVLMKSNSLQRLGFPERSFFARD